MSVIPNDLEQLCVKPEISIKEAMTIIDRGAKQIALVIDDRNQLLGTLTDGDIRRGLLRGATLDHLVKDVMHVDFISANLIVSREALADAVRRGVRVIPILDSSGVPQSLYQVDSTVEKIEERPEVVLMAGGLGSRLRPLTDNTAKPMLEIDGKPILQRIIEGFVSQGYNRFHLSVNYKAEQIVEHFRDGSEFNASIHYLHEKQRLGTAGALSLIEKRPSKPFIVMNSDLFTSLRFDSLVEFHLDTKASATICLRQHEVEVPYGVVRTSNLKVVDLVEKPKYINYINSGIYVLSPEVFDYIEYNKFLDMPDLMKRLIKDNRVVIGFPMHEYWIDIGQIPDLERAREEVPRMIK